MRPPLFLPGVEIESRPIGEWYGRPGFNGVWLKCVSEDENTIYAEKKYVMEAMAHTIWKMRHEEYPKSHDIESCQG